MINEMAAGDPPAPEPPPERKPIFPQVRHLSDYEALPAHDPDAICDILSRGEMCMVGSYAGVGKSPLFGPQFGYAAAAGGSFFGLKFYRPLKVLCIGFENSPYRQRRGNLGVKAHLFATFTEAQKALVEQNYVDFMYCDSKLANDLANKPGSGRRFLAWLDGVLLGTHYDLVILDPYASISGCSWTDQQATTAFLRDGLSELAVLHNCAFSIVHHFGKPKDGSHAGAECGIGPMYLFNGSGDMQGFFRAFIALVPTEFVDDDGQRIYSLQTDKRSIAWQDAEGHTADKTGRPYSEMWVRWSTKIWKESRCYAWEHSPCTPNMAAELKAKKAIAEKVAAQREKDAVKLATKGL